MRIAWIAVVVVVAVSVIAEARSGGPPAETVIADDGCSCHGALNAGTAITIGAPQSYAPGDKSTITISSTTSIVNAGVNKGGFLAWASAGTFSVPATNAAYFQTETLSGKSVIKHTLTGDQQNVQQQWSMQWTAPAAGTGTVTLKVYVNRVNGDTGTGGDGWNRAQKQITENAATSSTTTASTAPTTHSVPTTETSTAFSTSPRSDGPTPVDEPSLALPFVAVALLAAAWIARQRR